MEVFLKWTFLILARILFLFLVISLFFQLGFKGNETLVVQINIAIVQMVSGDKSSMLFCEHPEGGKEKQISACSPTRTTPVKHHWGQVCVTRIRMSSHKLTETETTSVGVFVKGWF